MDDVTAMMTAALQQPAQQEVLPPETRTRPLGSSRGETVDKILLFCGLQEKLSQSTCLHCERAVLAMSNKPVATLYCSALYRDLEVCITDCTSFTPV